MSVVVLFSLVALCRSKVPETDRVGSLRGSGRSEEGNILSLRLEPPPPPPPPPQKKDENYLKNSL